MNSVTLADLKSQFGTATERRVELFERFTQWLAAARATGAVRRVWIFGSFAATQPGPGDLDIVALFAADFDPNAVAVEARHWFDHELCRALHEIDLFTMKETTPPEVQTMILETFGRSRDGQESIIEVQI